MLEIKFQIMATWNLLNMKLLFSILFIFFGVYITIWNFFIDPYIKQNYSEKFNSSIKVFVLFVFSYLFLIIILLLLLKIIIEPF